MDRYETMKVLSAMKAAYPAFYKGMNADEMNQIVNLWTEMFSEESYGLVSAAVKALITADEKQYRPPHIGAVKSYIRKLTQPEDMTEAEAWGLVRKAAGNSIYDSQKEFDKLPPVLQRLVGSPSQLKEWAMMDSGEFQTVVASNFQRSYRAKATAEREYQSIPADVKAIAESLSGKLALQDSAQRLGEWTNQ